MTSSMFKLAVSQSIQYFLLSELSLPEEAERQAFARLEHNMFS